MKALLLHRTTDLTQNLLPLTLEHVDDPSPGAMDLLIQVKTCGVCHTELDEIEGRLTPPEFPIILGHQIVGEIIGMGNQCSNYKPGDRVGVGWIYDSCGKCAYCKQGLENLCPQFKATGKDAHGGYAEKMCIPETSAFPIPELISDTDAAPLLCAGVIGYRSLALTNLKDGENLGLSGFGSSGHLVLKMAKHLYPNVSIFVFARNPSEREFAMELGAVWTGEHTDTPPERLHAIIDTTPVWKPIVEGLRNLAPNGRLVVNAIRKESVDQDILLQLNYPEHLWMEKEIKSVANVTRNDIREFLKLAADLDIRPKVQTYKLEEANRAVVELKQGKIHGAKVLVFG